MSDAEFVILFFLGIIGVYIFLRGVFNMSHRATIITMIVSGLGAYRSLSRNESERKSDK